MRILVSIVVLAGLAACDPTTNPVDGAQFVTEPKAVAINPGQIDEASGIVASRSMPGNLWVQQDSGNPTDIALLSQDGTVKGKIALPAPIDNRDWEDMGIGPGPQAGTNYIYLADTGDNNLQYPFYLIYRFPEPKSLTEPVTQAERMFFKYPGGISHDAEALIVDPQTKDIWIITKREQKVRLYRFAYPQNINDVTTVQDYGELPMSVVTGAAISSDGNEILVRTYTNIYYWKRQNNEPIAETLQRREGRSVPYRLEPQGEAVCFDKDDKGYFTLSERNNAASVSLYYYAKK